MPRNRFKTHSVLCVVLAAAPVASDDTEALRRPSAVGRPPSAVPAWDGWQFEVSRPGTTALVRFGRRIFFPCFLCCAAEDSLAHKVRGGVFCVIDCFALLRWRDCPWSGSACAFFFFLLFSSSFSPGGRRPEAETNSRQGLGEE